MKVLLTGGSGLLGNSLMRCMPAGHDVTVTYLNNPVSYDSVRSVKMDLTDLSSVSVVIDKIKPDLIIHTAAATDIEWCEGHPKEAMEINSHSTRLLAGHAKSTGIRMAYISTDHVFDGKRGNYRETDEAFPMNVYGKTKLLGESYVNGLSKGLIIRTNMYGTGTGSAERGFISAILENTRSGKAVLAAHDQFSNPIFVDQLSGTIWRLLETGERGIFHIACQDKMSRYEFATSVCDAFGLDKGLIKRVDTPTLTSNLGWKAKRPSDSSLDVSKIGRLDRMPTIKESLAEFRRNADGRAG